MNSINYSAVPFVRLLLPLLVGRVLSLFVPTPLISYLLIFALSLLVITFLFRSSGIRYSKRWIVGVIIPMALLTFGIINKPNYSFDASLLAQQRVYRAIVKQVIKDADDKQSLILSCVNIDSTSQYYFNALMYVRNDSIDKLLPGDKIAYEATLSEIKLTGNPFAFEYANYMKNKGVEGQFFTERQNVQRLGRSFSVNRFFYQARQKAEGKLRLLPLNEEEFAIVSALVLGNKSMLNYQTKANFSSAGAIHVLSISGLHVGIIYLMLMSLLGRIGKGAIALVKVLIVIFALWFYAAISGMSPSVSRATLMFSIFVIAKWKSHRYNIYHSMAIAAFIILIIKPDSAIHAGFWLSFLAVASIVYFYPLINGVWYFSSPWGKYTWALVSVSLAAQIGTLPLSLFLFGFFPTWFILSNILIIPVLPIMLVGAIMVIVLPGDSIVMLLVADAISAMFGYLNEITAWTGCLPFARYTRIQLQFYQVFVFYVSLISFVMWRHLKRGKYLVYGMTFLWIGITGISVATYNKYHQQVFSVHQVKDKTAITVTSIHQCECWLNESLDTKEIDYAVLPLVLHQQAQNLYPHKMDSIVVCPIPFKGKNILVLNGEVDIKKLGRNTDIIVFTAKLKSFQIKKMLDTLNGQTLIFDSSFSNSQSRYLQKELINRKLNAHFVMLDGAYSMTI
ncbi:ComEC/Rec2 family competence protein [Saccharicrinis sp. GN24d3]|uniref:ComEC/Rec2 family competence protein n=1 Tax=Saccharicrinis sp. GN24d3 TaxID=3458416 RepID=UPI0040375EB6